MLFKLAAVAVLLPLASAQFAYTYVYTTPTDWVSGQPANVSWTAEVGDPEQYTLLLKIFNETTNSEDNWVLAQGIDTYSYFANFTLPDVVPADGYFLLPVSVKDTSTEGPPSNKFSIA
ncbi:hypothetical protein IEO21_07180 [Rhodonia placenta]|uniref:Yeast cell wall synthesis Kre9/Knh1-like N-terminal domain-containing protein n=1 Tax=Rhodonia placenta TaxID=104341 RepID=A0A8H7NYH3_9APHY|nr:hypothetical protein IEO21_07180 [Postia placenta]